MTDITIYHNPACGTSRNVLALIRERGIEPQVIEYLKNTPSRAKLVEITGRLEGGVRALLRKKGTPYEKLRLDDSKWTDDKLIGFILEHPILMNRPLVVMPKAVRLCRPAEKVLELLTASAVDEAAS